MPHGHRIVSVLRFHLSRIRLCYPPVDPGLHRSRKTLFPHTNKNLLEGRASRSISVILLGLKRQRAKDGVRRTRFVLDEVCGDEEKWTSIIRTLKIYFLTANMDLTGSLAAYEGVIMRRPCSITVP